jgi:hypothetical protein
VRGAEGVLVRKNLNALSTGSKKTSALRHQTPEIATPKGSYGQLRGSSTTILWSVPCLPGANVRVAALKEIHDSDVELLRRLAGVRNEALN